MFEDGKWQPLRPHQPANRGQKRVGLTEFSFGPEMGDDAGRKSPIEGTHEVSGDPLVGLLWLGF